MRRALTARGAQGERAGTTILYDIAQIEEIDTPPGTSDQVAGQIAFPALQQTAGRRAVLRDREAFPVEFAVRASKLGAERSTRAGS